MKHANGGDRQLPGDSQARGGKERVLPPVHRRLPRFFTTIRCRFGSFAESVLEQPVAGVDVTVMP